MRRLTGACSDALLSLVSGPPRDAIVVGAGPHATYLQLDEPDGELVAVVTRHAVRVPCAVLLPEGVEPPADLQPGTAVEVGEQRLRWAGGELTVTRWWPAAAVTGATGQPPAASVAADAGLSARVAALRAPVGQHALPESVPAALDQAIQAIDHADGVGVAAAIIPVLGFGAGLTPAADDAAAGLLLVARSWYGTQLDPVLSSARELLVPHLDRRTTAVSAGLLRHAAEGRGAPEVVGAVEHLTGRRAEDEREVLRRLVQLGHTSGRDTALGVLAFLGPHAARTARPTAPTSQQPATDRDDRPAVPQHDPPARESA